MSDIRAYTKKFLRELILLYRSVPCLWRVKSKGYLDRNMKDKAWKTIVTKFREVDSDTDKASAMKKMNSLKTSWRRENKKVRESIRFGAGADEVYMPKLWYFELLRFVEDDETPQESLSNIDETMDGHEEQSDEINTSSTNEQIAAPEHSHKVRQALSKKFKRSNDDSLVSATEALREITGNPKEDEFQLFGKSLGAQFSQLPLEDAIELQIEFHNMIGQRRLAIIRRGNRSSTCTQR